MRRNRKICAECPYYKEKGKAPIGLENNGSKVLLLFQAPGKDEWDGKTYNSRRIPVASKNKSSAGMRIKNSLERIGKVRQDFDYAETVMCYPEKNSSGRDKKPSEKAIHICIKYLNNEIEKNGYTTIICFGKVAENAIKSLSFSTNIDIRFYNHPCYHMTKNKLDEILRCEDKVCKECE